MRKILHLSKMYKQYWDLDPSVAINQIHQALYAEFQQKMNGTLGGVPASGSQAAAKELQDFFQTLKAFHQTGVMTPLGAVEGAVIEEVNNTMTSGQWKKFFVSMGKGNYKQGDDFEKQLSQILAAVRDVASGGSGNRTSIDTAANAMVLGQAKVGMIKDGKFGNISSLAKNMGKALIEQKHHQLDQLFNIKKKSPNHLVASAVDGKIDVSGLMTTWTIKAEATPYLMRIATLLSQANFSAKSYKSQHWKKEIADYIKNKMNLGRTQTNRVFFDLFTSFDYPPAVSLAMLIVLNRRGQFNLELQQQLSRLRFIYELTGRGQTYLKNTIRDTFEKVIGQSWTEVNYIIYNDPQGNIYVKSTAEIIIEMWNFINEMFKRQVSIDKSYFFNQI